jgi:hypothetical protein
LKNTEMLPNYFKQRNPNFRKSAEELDVDWLQDKIISSTHQDAS